MTLFAEGPLEKSDLLSDTLGHGVIDCGCTKTVNGKAWLDSYVETLSRSDRMLIEYHKDNTKFRFGDGPVSISNQMVVIPITLGSRKFKLHSCVVDNDVPLLISRTSLKRAEADIRFGKDELWISGEHIPIVEFQSGHMGVSLMSRDVKQTVKHVLFSCPLQSDDDQANERKII